MAKVSDLGNSKYLQQSDVEGGVTVTISHYTHQNVAQDNEPKQERYVLHFQEDIKPLVLNKTNGSLIEMVTGSDDLEAWAQQKITLYRDPTISFGGKIVGGIRVQVPTTGGITQGQQHQHDQASDDQPPPTEDPRDFSEGDPDLQ